MKILQICWKAFLYIKISKYARKYLFSIKFVVD